MIDNDPGSTAAPNPNYLTVIGTINLCNPLKETCPAAQSLAGPHGMFFSPVSGKIYNNNETHGTVNVINPAATDFNNAIEQTFDIGFAAATYITPDGRFIIVRGAQSNTTMTGRLTIIDVAAVNPVPVPVDLPDVNPADLAFTSDGKKLYVPSAGSATPKAGQKSSVVQVYDASALPALPLIKEIAVGATAAGRSIGILEEGGAATHVFVTNRADGTVSVIDATTDTAIDTVQVGGTPTSLLVFPMEGNLSH